MVDSSDDAGCSVTLPPPPRASPDARDRRHGQPWERGGAIRVGLVEVVDEGWVQNVILVCPRPLLGTVPLPIYEVLKPAAPPSGVEDFFDCVDGFVGSDLGWRGGGYLMLCGGREKRISEGFEQGDVKGGIEHSLT